jgi:polygalacturonase
VGAPSHPSSRYQPAVECLEPRCLLSPIPLPTIPDQTFDVTSYGAVGDGTTVDTAAIQNAINAAHAAGGGTVRVPAGIYLSGPLRLASSINLEVDGGATLRMLPRGSYPSSSTPFLTVSSLNNVEISGAGVIDGQGAGWWASSSRPRLIQVSNSSIVAFAGVTLLNSPREHLAFGATNNVTINGITISAPANSPNTDGIDVAGSNYLIENCTIATGDDNIAMKPQNVANRNITITNCTFGSGHGLSIGGQTNDGLDGLTVTNCAFNGTMIGLRMKAGRGFGGLVQNVSYDQITMTNVATPLWVTSYYQNGTATDPSNPAQDPGQPVTGTTPFWQNISYSNITATGATNAGTFYGLPEAPIVNVTLTNVNIQARSSLKIYHAQNVQFINSTIAPATLLTYDATVSSPSVPVFLDAGFELPFVGVGTSDAYQYGPSGSPWTFTDTAGVAGDWGGLTDGNADAPQGTQVAFLQDFGSLSQDLTFPASTYTLSFWAAQRGDGNASSQTFQVLVDGAPVSTVTPADTTYTAFTTDSFTLADGVHTVSFVGLDPDGQDNAAFLDQVSINLAGPGPRAPFRATGADLFQGVVADLTLWQPPPRPEPVVRTASSGPGAFANGNVAPVPGAAHRLAVDALFSPRRNSGSINDAKDFLAGAGVTFPTGGSMNAAVSPEETLVSKCVRCFGLVQS